MAAARAQTVYDDAIQTAASTSDFRPVVGWLVILALVTLFTTLSGSLQFELQRLLSQNVNRLSMVRIFEVAAVASLEAFEMPDFHNRMERAWMSSGSRPM
jgi:ATP-binding cassette subfamily B protein